MTSRFRSIFLGLFVFAFVAFLAKASTQTMKPGWKGTITTENGIKVVKNPSEPLYGTFAFDLQEDLVLGGNPEKADSYFPSGAQVSVDGEANLYVSDWGDKRIKVFDKSGRFLRPLGRQGQGPGEYMFPGLAQFDREGNIYLSSGREVNIYGKDGVFLKKVLLSAFFSQSMLGPGAGIIGTLQPRSGDPKHSLVLFDTKTQTSVSIAESRGEFEAGQIAVILHAYGSAFSFSPLTDDTFVYGFSSEYRISAVDGKGKTRLIFTKDEKPESITADEKDANAKQGPKIWIGTSNPDPRDIRYPAHRPFFRGFMNDDAGRLYVKKLNSILEKDSPTTIDVFSKEGVYLYRMTWKSAPAVIKAGFFYEVRQDEETGETKIVRSRIRNWDKMKIG